MTRSLFSAALLAALALPAAAQTSAPLAPPFALPTEADLAPRVEARTIAALASADAAVRGRALHALAERAIADAAFDLEPALPVLFGIYRTDAVEGHRLMALHALHALHASGDEAAMAALRNEVHTPAPPAVRRALLATLLDHDGADGVRAIPAADEVALDVLDG